MGSRADPGHLVKYYPVSLGSRADPGKLQTSTVEVRKLSDSMNKYCNVSGLTYDMRGCDPRITYLYLE